MGYEWDMNGDIVGVSINGVPKGAAWLIRENPNLKWMMTAGTPILGNLHIYIYVYIYA